MIVVKLLGGLGNQMFQYAAGRALATKHGVPLKIDISALKNDSKGAYTQRHYELDCFNIQATIATEKDLAAFQPFHNNQILRLAQRKFPFLFSSIYFAESGSQFNSTFNNLKSNSYLDGYWQSEAYFKNIRVQLLSDFVLKDSMPRSLETWCDKITSVNSVSMHVRRGDYVNLPSANAFHGLCSMTYYENAFSKLQAEEQNLEIFVFSDDITWCKQNFNFRVNTHFVEHTDKAYWDLYLMSLCKHNIIANSSFSWWGAWLNQHTNKRVFVPEYWFTNIKSHSIDILAPNWESI